MASTIVAFHAHPDDEALLSGGTLAMLSAVGHRVVLVVATAGDAGLADPDGGPLARRRLAELQASADVLGCARLVTLGFQDSGWIDSGRGPSPAASFAGMDLQLAADRLCQVLDEEKPDVLMIYDRNGGYGHPDHVRVHEAGILAAQRSGIGRVMQVTVDRTNLSRIVRILRALRLLPENTAVDRLQSWFSARDEITHRIDVRCVGGRKRRALACHRSQTEGGKKLRTAAILLALPVPFFRKIVGTEWFVELGVVPPPRPFDDFFETAHLVGAAAQGSSGAHDRSRGSHAPWNHPAIWSQGRGDHRGVAG